MEAGYRGSLRWADTDGSGERGRVWCIDRQSKKSRELCVSACAAVTPVRAHPDNHVDVFNTSLHPYTPGMHTHPAM